MLFWIYFAEPQRASVMKRMLEDEARRVANGIVRRVNEGGDRDGALEEEFSPPGL